jgi:hypothetical protein
MNALRIFIPIEMPYRLRIFYGNYFVSACITVFDIYSPSLFGIVSLGLGIVILELRIVIPEFGIISS